MVKCLPNFKVNHIEFHIRLKTPFTVCKYLHCFRRYLIKFQKCVKYANEMIDEVIHSTKYYIKHIINNYPAKSRRISSDTIQTIFREIEQDNCFIIQQIDNKTA